MPDPTPADHERARFLCARHQETTVEQDPNCDDCDAIADALADQRERDAQSAENAGTVIILNGGGRAGFRLGREAAAAAIRQGDA